MPFVSPLPSPLSILVLFLPQRIVVRLELVQYYSKFFIVFQIFKKGPMTYGSTEEDSECSVLRFSVPPPLQTLRMATQAPRLAFRSSGWPSRPSGWPPDPQANLPGPSAGLPGLLAGFHTLTLASQALWLASKND